jgi:hypothetical protein
LIDFARTNLHAVSTTRAFFLIDNRVHIQDFKFQIADFKFKTLNYL